MDRVYKAIRLASETKYCLDVLVSKYSEELFHNMKDNNLQEKVEDLVQAQFETPLRGTALTITINVTTGSIIEQAVKLSRNLTAKDYESLAKEIAKFKIPNEVQTDATPKIYISKSILEELEQRRFCLKSIRIPKLSYIIKLAVYYMYKREVLD